MSKPIDKIGHFNVYKVDGGFYFEHDMYGDEHACRTFHDKLDYIYDFDECAMMPHEVGEWLYAKGYNVEWNHEREYWTFIDYIK